MPLSRRAQPQMGDMLQTAGNTTPAFNGSAQSAIICYRRRIVITIRPPGLMSIEPNPVTMKSAATTCAVQRKVSAVVQAVLNVVLLHY